MAKKIHVRAHDRKKASSRGQVVTCARCGGTGSLGILDGGGKCDTCGGKGKVRV